MPFDQNLTDASNVQGFLHFIVRKPNPIHARNRSALHTNEMRMAASIMGWISDLEPPNMVPQLRSTDQFRIREIAKISENSRFVETDRYQFVR